MICFLKGLVATEAVEIIALLKMYSEYESSPGDTFSTNIFQKIFSETYFFEKYDSYSA